MRIPLPEELTRIVSERAVQNVRANVTRREWSEKAVQSFTPVSREGQAGVRTSLNYLMYQEKGFGPFTMWSLEGKIVPIEPGRFVTARGVGKPGFVTLPGGVKQWRNQKWRHPGLEPKGFMKNSISQAVLESRSQVQTLLKQTLEGRQT